MEKAVLMMAKKVLIVEDDSNIAELLNLYLEKEPEEKNDHIEQDQPVHDNGAALVEQALLHRISPIFLLCSHIRPYVNVFRAL